MKSKLLLFVLLISCFVFVGAHKVNTVQMVETVYIGADGAVDPQTAPILNKGNNTYSLTSDAFISIIVQRDNITIEGSNRAIQGIGNGTGIDLSGRRNVTIRNINIRSFWHGILLAHSSGNTISGNNIIGNGCGMRLLEYSSTNLISGNNLVNNSGGIELNEYSSNNWLLENNVTGSVNGIPLSHCYSNTILRNNLKSNSNGIYLQHCSNNNISTNTLGNNRFAGITLYSSSNENIISHNTITESDCCIRLSEYCSRNSVFGNLVTGGNGILLEYSSDCEVYGNIADHCINGIWLLHCSNNNIVGNNVTYSDCAAGLASSSTYNNITGNLLASNNWAIRSFDSQNNALFHNNLIDNRIQAFNSNSTNTWDDGSKGNYWNDYFSRYPDAHEIGTSGIGDTAYEIDANNTDRYPLMNEYVIPEFPSIPSVLLFTSTTLMAIILRRKKR